MKTARLKVNVKLFRKMQKYIIEEPRRLEMCTWVIEGDDVAPCGTAACIAGTALLLNGPARLKSNRLRKIRKLGNHTLSITEFTMAGAKALGLSYTRASRAFIAQGNHWPSPFREKHQIAKGLFDGDEITEQKYRRVVAKLAVKLIDKIIETDGKILDY